MRDAARSFPPGAAEEKALQSGGQSGILPQNGVERENNGDSDHREGRVCCERPGPEAVWFARELRRNGRRPDPVIGPGGVCPR